MEEAQGAQRGFGKASLGKHRVCHSPFGDRCAVCGALRGRDWLRRFRGRENVLTITEWKLTWLVASLVKVLEKTVVVALVRRGRETERSCAHAVPSSVGIEWVSDQVARGP